MRKSVAIELITSAIGGIIILSVNYALNSLALSIPVQIVTFGMILAGGFMLYNIKWINEKVRTYGLIFLMLFCMSISLNLALILQRSNLIANGSLSIQSVPLSVSAYEGARDPKGGLGTGRFLINRTDDANAVYHFTYTLPDKGYGYTGLSFKFSEPLNLTNYKFIQVIIYFEEQARCDLYLKDANGAKDYIHLGERVPTDVDITVNIVERTHVVKIPIGSNFDSINLKIVSEIVFDVDTRLTRGSGNFEIKGITFTK